MSFFLQAPSFNQTPTGLEIFFSSDYTLIGWKVHVWYISLGSQPGTHINFSETELGRKAQLYLKSSMATQRYPWSPIQILGHPYRSTFDFGWTGTSALIAIFAIKKSTNSQIISIYSKLPPNPVLTCDNICVTIEVPSAWTIPCVSFHVPCSMCIF